MKSQILVVDDHSIVRVGMEHLITKALNADTMGVSNLEEARKLIKKKKVDLIILDIGIPDWEGMHGIRDLKKLAPAARILVCSAHCETVYALRCMDAGADGYLQKTVDQEEIKKAIIAVLNGGQYISPQLKDFILEYRLRSGQIKDDNPLHLLSERELEICEFLRQGMKNNEIAARINLHASTISTHKVRIFQKLQVTSIQMLIEKMKIHDQFIG